MGEADPFFTLHGIDINKEKPNASQMKGSTDPLEEWKNTLITKIYEGEKRRFKFNSGTCEVVALVKQIVANTDKDTCALHIAERLLQKEKGAQEKMARLGIEIQRGALFQVFTEYNGSPAYLMAKIEHEEFLDEVDLQKHSGLPFDKTIFKTCFITFDDENQVLEVLVSDNKRKKISEYWAYDFLEVVELTTNEHNTRVAFNAVEVFITKKLKKKHPADYVQIRNNLVGYFRTTETFSFVELLDRMIGAYVPEDPELDIVVFRQGLEAVPSKLKGENVFEQTFDIVKSEITARFKKSIDLTDKITLRLKEDIENLENVIASFLHEGKKCIRIETEQGYEYFKKDKQPPNGPDQ